MEYEKGLQIWSRACDKLRDILSKDVYERWIAVITYKGYKDEVYHLSVTNDFYLSWLEENYSSLISEAISSVTGAPARIQLVVERDAVPEPEGDEEEAPKSRRPRRQGADANLNKDYTFENFVIGPSNNFSHAAAMAVAQSPSRAYNPLFIYGGTGLGKTHLMQAIGNFVLSKNRRKRVSYLSCETFTNEYIDALGQKKLTQFRKRYRNVDLLLIDDIHFLRGKQQMQEEFFHTFNALFQNRKQIVLTCDRPASELKDLTPRLVSRFEWGLVTELEVPDIETRIAILRHKSEYLNLAIPESLLFFLAERISTNIRRLEGGLIRVASYISLTGKKDKKDIEYLLRDTLDQQQDHYVPVDLIQRTVARHFGIHVADLMGKKRPRSIAHPRQIAMYLARCLTQESLPSLGGAFGRNHATILHAYRQVEKRTGEDNQIRQTVNTLKQKIAAEARGQTV
ncbi:chromosomal replication initiator protein DnaA [Kiritimatiella glycovorans]|uniref:Chromosomal replication initiator protein DnaA n=1 Tax=Kiritimatiella glycovorans TaxID=1307763 RepID=A0A0G3ED07_9BACT|nr:chromosomal replication initiator protein DnaA [Kiritimatiella glycovorans]AKJ63292.1 Chromosomal replication initiator protein DnaA [Kiritimatiella glycovorans]